MRSHYDFSKGIKNPYADTLKKQITIRLDDSVIDYFKDMAKRTGISYQNIINAVKTFAAQNAVSNIYVNAV